MLTREVLGVREDGGEGHNKGYAEMHSDLNVCSGRKARTLGLLVVIDINR